VFGMADEFLMLFFQAFTLELGHVPLVSKSVIKTKGL
jgi:hypothetical protein